MKFFIPIKRDPKTLPPVISLIRGLADLGHEVHFLSYYHSPETTAVLSHPRITITQISAKPYPAGLVARFLATARAHFALWKRARSMPPYDVLWIACWDYLGLKALSRFRRDRSRSVYHFHEFEPERFGLCRAADLVVVPEENRAWITYVMAGLRTRPLVLPNIPFDHPRKADLAEPSLLDQLKAEGKIILLYQGYCSIRGRCMFEMLDALALADQRIVLCIMPAPGFTQEIRAELEVRITTLGVGSRVCFVPGKEAPAHMNVVGRAHIGIGLYRPTSINQIYCAPNRLYEFTGFGIPVILPSTPAIEQLAARYPGIVTCDPTSPTSIAAALNGLVDSAAYAKAAAGARSFFGNEGSYVSKLESVVSRLS